MKVLSLFSGGGGLDIGFHKAGFDVVATLEIDKKSCETLELNRTEYLSENCKIFNADITQTPPETLGINEVDFIIGGPPCQSFSAAGRRAGGVTGINDTRGSLFWYYCQYLKHFQPKGFLFENVRGILQANKSDDWTVIQQSFRDVGYKLFYRIIDAAGFGIPQHRERVIMVGVRSDISHEYLFPRPIHGPDSENKKPYVTAREAFVDIDDPNEVVPQYTGKYGHLLEDIPPGQNYSHYTERMGHPKPLFAWRSKFSGFLYKLDPDGLSKTLVAQQGKYDGPFHWKNRKLNSQELMKIQGFPSDYLFVDSKAETAKQIGNSVSPKLAYYLALSVKKQFFKSNSVNVELINHDVELSFDKRKGLKAKATKRRGRMTTNQPTLFDERFEWPEKKIKEEVSFSFNPDDKFVFEAKLSKGIWNISLIKNNTPIIHEVELELIFDSPVGKNFEKIKGRLFTDDEFDVSNLWQAIHRVVDVSCSYTSLEPLYGHFTEPYPRFKVIMSASVLDGTENKVVKLLKQFSDFSHVKALHDLSGLEEVSELSLKDLIRKLRASHFDVRTHETNRAIPIGKYKICYPFAMNQATKNFVVWSEIGEHKTGDIRFISKGGMRLPMKVSNTSSPK